MIGRNVLLALLLSLLLTFVVTVVYIFYPLIIVIITDREGAGIGSASGGLNVFLLFAVEFVLFVIIFSALQWMGKRGRNNLR